MITIFIHGTLPPAPVLKITGIANFLASPQGINKITNLDLKYHNVQIGYALAKADPNKFDINKFYLFGWSGSLNSEKRKLAARDLYRQINLITKEYYQEYKITPSVRLIGSSHGGNVALYLKEIAEENIDSNFSIEELILLACPVQIKTAKFIHHKIFKRAYSLHSHHDIIQVLDPQGIHKLIEILKTNGLNLSAMQISRLGPIFSHRHFKHAQNLKQIWIKINDRNLLHIEFLFLKFIEQLPKILEMTDRNEAKQKINKQSQYLDIIINLRAKLDIITTTNSYIVINPMGLTLCGRSPS